MHVRHLPAAPVGLVKPMSGRITDKLARLFDRDSDVYKSGRDVSLPKVKPVPPGVSGGPVGRGPNRTKK